MPNDFLTTQLIARSALVVLRNNLVMGNLVRRDFDSEPRQKGDTFQVRKYPTFTAQEFSTTTSAQNVTEDKVLVTLDKIADVSVEITAKELSLSIDDFTALILTPAVQAIAQKVDNDLVKLYKDIPFHSGTAGTTPSTAAALLAARKVLNDNKVPLMDRVGVISTAAEAKLLELDTFAEADKRGDATALREASLGRVYGFDWYTSQNVDAHAVGTRSGGTATGTAGASSITVASGGNNATYKKGDLLTIAGDTTQYTVTADATLNGSGGGTVSLYPVLATSPSGANITHVAAHTPNLLFHPNAFALVMRPLAAPIGGAQSYQTSFEGLTLRVTMDYEMSSKKNLMSVDCLYGVKTLQPELAVRLLG